MPELPEQRLQAYIEQMLKLQHEHRHGPLRVEELERLASELGLSQAEQDFIDHRFEDYLYRGKGFLRHRNVEAALAELKQAVLIKPLHRDALYYLAEAFYQKSLASGRKSDREEARHYAERCLQSDARHEEALRLLNRLYQKPSRFWQKKHFWRGMGGALALSLLLTGLVYFYPYFLPNSERALPSENGQTGPGASIEKSPRSLPVQLLNLPQKPAFGLYTESSLIGQTTTEAFYEWRGALRNPSGHETEELALSLELRDAEGRLLSFQDGLVSWEQNQFPLGPEDALPLVIRHRLELSLSDKIAEARLRMVEAKLRRVDKTWEEGPLQARNFAKTGLKIWERGQLIRPEADFFYHDLALAIAHQGPKPLQALAAEIVWYDQNEQLIHSEIVKLIRNDEPALPPGQKRLFWGSFRIDHKREDYQRYEIKAVAPPIYPPAQ